MCVLADAASLHTKVATLQDQLTQLALALLHQRDRNVEQRLSTLETAWPALRGRTLSSRWACDCHQQRVASEG
ncbi:MAG TPA: hypothetical protein VGN34_01105 [Ktedonobacteraceae bacterium]